MQSRRRVSPCAPAPEAVPSLIMKLVRCCCSVLFLGDALCHGTLAWAAEHERRVVIQNVRPREYAASSATPRPPHAAATASL